MTEPQLSAPQLNQLYQYALVYCDQPADAYDILQSSLESYLSKKIVVENPMAYLRRSIKNLWVDTYRKNVSRENYEKLPFDIAESTLESIIVEQDLIQKIWHQLIPDERELLYYWAVLEFSMAEISKELNVPRGTLLSRMHRMRKRIESSPYKTKGGAL